MEFAYKKSLGQNFIYDTDFLRAMVAGLHITKDDTIVEIGPGAGTLTKVLAAQGGTVQAVEIDARLKPILQKELAACANVHLIWGDALQQDFAGLAQFRLIANVPYYITTPLIMKFLAMPNCTDINILVAREVADRIVAPVGTAAYGALSVACQLLARCDIVKIVPRTMFTPVPKVDSAFVRLVKNGQAVDAGLTKLLKGVFAARRKTMLNALAMALGCEKTVVAAILQQAGVAADLRPEQVTPTQYAQIRVISLNYGK